MRYSFHTTQYDLNAREGVPRGMGAVFPYYIVRFKHYIRDPFSSTRSGFHTTQYDLNKATPIKPKRRIAGFHTTQYDLNQKGQKIILHAIQSFHTTQYDLNLKKLKITGSTAKGFHTTQYDLNSILFIFFYIYELYVSILHSTI